MSPFNRHHLCDAGGWKQLRCHDNVVVFNYILLLRGCLEADQQMFALVDDFLQVAFEFTPGCVVLGD